MKTYEKVLIGVGAATITAAGVTLALRYQMVKEAEEKAANSPRGKINATTDMVRSKFKREEIKEESKGVTFTRRLLKALGIYHLIVKK